MENIHSNRQVRCVNLLIQFSGDCDKEIVPTQRIEVNNVSYSDFRRLLRDLCVYYVFIHVVNCIFFFFLLFGNN